MESTNLYGLKLLIGPGFEAKQTHVAVFLPLCFDFKRNPLPLQQM